MGGEHDGLPVGPLVQLRVAAEDDDARFPEALRAEREPGPHAEPEPVSQRSGRSLHAGDLVPVRVRPERVAVLEEPVEELLREEALRGEDGVIRGRSVPLAEDEPVAPLVAWVREIDAQDPVVEDPDRVERGGAALVVLLVARRTRHERTDAVDAGADHHRAGRYNLKRA